MTRHVSDVWPDDRLPELIEAREAVQRTLDSPGWRAIQDLLACEIATIDSELEHGPTKEAAGYAKALGRRSAIRASQEAAKAIIEKANRREQQAIEQVAAESATERIGV